MNNEPDDKTAVTEPVDDAAAVLAAVDAGLADMGKAPATEAAAPAQEPVEAAPAADGTEAKPDPAAAEKADDEKAADAAAAEKVEADRLAAEKATADAKTEDLDTLPDGVKEQTTKRFEKLKADKQAVVAERDQAVIDRDAYKQQATQWHEIVSNTGATPDQFNSALTYLSAVNSGTPAGLNAAFDMMLGEARALGKLLGREVPGLVDPIEDHPDLKSGVDTGAIDPKYAAEIARQRAAEKLTTAQQYATQQRERAATESTQAQQAGFDGIRSVGARLLVIDPHYKAKATADRVQGIVQNIMDSGAPPAKWGPMFESMYRLLPDPAPVAAAPAAPRAPAAPDPLRASGTGGAATGKVAKTQLEAIDFGLAGMG